MFVAIKKFMLRHFSGVEKYDKLVATKLYVVTQDTAVATRTRLLHHNYVATESKKKAKKPVRIETASYDRIWGTKIKTLLQHNFLCCDKATNWAKFFLGSTKAALKCGPPLETL